MRRRVRAAAALAAILPAMPAAAGPPYVTDDPEPTAYRRWEVYGFVSGLVRGDGREGAAGLDINYGAAPGLQASAVVSAGYDRTRGARAVAGIADTQIGLKYRLLRQRERGWRPDVAIFPKLLLPTGGRRGAGRTGVQVPLWLQKDAGGWSLFGGGGWQVNPGRGNRDFGFAGLALSRAVSPALALGGEVYRQGADAVGGRATTGVGLGATLAIARHWSLIGSGGPLIAHRAATGHGAAYLALAFHD